MLNIKLGDLVVDGDLRLVAEQIQIAMGRRIRDQKSLAEGIGAKYAGQQQGGEASPRRKITG